VGWKWKVGAYRVKIGCSTCKSSPQAAFDECLTRSTTKSAGMCPRLLEGLLRLPQRTANGQRIALHKVMDEVKQIRDTQARQARFGQLDQGLCPVTHEVQHPDAQ